MYTTLYGMCLLVSVVVLIYMAQKNYNSVDTYQWTIVVLVPVILLAYWLESRVDTPGEAAFLICFKYLDSTFIITAVLFSTLHTLGVSVKSWMKVVAYSAATLQMAVVCLCVNNGLYYSGITITDTGQGVSVETSAGPLKILHQVYLIFLLLWILMILLISLKRQGWYSQKNLFVLLYLALGAFIIYFISASFSYRFSPLPFLYTLADVVVVWRYDSAHVHDISLLIANQHDRQGTRGYLAVGLNGLYLGCNDKCYEFVPFLRQQQINARLSDEDELGRMLWGLIQSFTVGGDNSVKYQLGEMTCVCEISYFSIWENGKNQGYLIAIRDATESQKAYDIIASYNERLNSEVQAKTASIKEMQRKIVLGMANMIENRDNNTGGHVKRTSDIIRILLDEIVRQGQIPMSAQMVDDIVRAAPTHDLGKITIDSSILTKPGKLTDEEYAIMKTHSAKSGELVHILLDGVEEERFVNVAFNVARYHHERWDGKGYPDGLSGTDIPMEARIMSVADVYDALVSKRCYKEPMSFEQSAAIMCENMGTQFDPSMEPVFLGCMDKLEQYYRDNT